MLLFVGVFFLPELPSMQDFATSCVFDFPPPQRALHGASKQLQDWREPALRGQTIASLPGALSLPSFCLFWRNPILQAQNNKLLLKPETCTCNGRNYSIFCRRFELQHCGIFYADSGLTFCMQLYELPYHGAGWAPDSKAVQLGRLCRQIFLSSPAGKHFMWSTLHVLWLSHFWNYLFLVWGVLAVSRQHASGFLSRFMSCRHAAHVLCLPSQKQTSNHLHVSCWFQTIPSELVEKSQEFINTMGFKSSAEQFHCIQVRLCKTCKARMLFSGYYYSHLMRTKEIGTQFSAIAICVCKCAALSKCWGMLLDQSNWATFCDCVIAIAVCHIITVAQTVANLQEILDKWHKDEVCTMYLLVEANNFLGTVSCSVWGCTNDGEVTLIISATTHWGCTGMTHGVQ